MAVQGPAQNERTRRPRLWFSRMQVTIVAYLVIIVILYFLQRNVAYQPSERVVELLEDDAFTASLGVRPPECLILWENDADGLNGRDHLSEVLEQMEIPAEALPVEAFDPARLEDYKTVALSVSYLGALGDNLLDLLGWVEKGGDLLFLYFPQPDGALQIVQERIGVRFLAGSWVEVDALHFPSDLIPGAALKDYGIVDPFAMSMRVTLTEDCEVGMTSAGEDPVPLLWRKPYGDGTIVVNNQKLHEKAYRGLTCAAYTLLGQVSAYPVINASVFYLDDFPSPVPDGTSQYIAEQYGLSIEDFYTQVWWRDIYDLAEDYGLRYTGLIIEQYSDKVAEPFPRNEDVQRFLYFGNMLLQQGGELGYHGYNHMPLCLKNFDYEGLYEGYRQWWSYEDMKAGMRELKRFSQEVFPQESFQVYVPPSNILSAEGKALLREAFPEIRAVASLYLPGDVSYTQEFEISEDGMIETPRVISGYILEEYMQLAALSELNMHYVNSHFQHPDDALDPERGAVLGWERMFGNLAEYVDWLSRAAPDIRQLTGIEAAAAVQQYDKLEVRRTLEDGVLRLELGGFGKEAWLMVRVNEGRPGAVAGGSLEEIGQGLYLLRAVEPRVEIELTQ